MKKKVISVSDADLLVPCETKVSHNVEALGAESLRERELQILSSQGVHSSTCTFLKMVRGLNEITSAVSANIVACIGMIWSEVRSIGERAVRGISIRYYLVGVILNEMDRMTKPKSRYMCWVRENFASEVGLEALRQAKRIASMGQYALNLIEQGLNKNQLLEVFYLFKKAPDIQRDSNGLITSEIMTHLLARCDFIGPDVIDMTDGQDVRTKVDTLITLFRMQEKGIDEGICSIEYARMIALFRTKAVEPKQVSGLKTWLDKEAEKRQEAAGQIVETDNQLRRRDFERWVLNRMAVPKISTPERAKKRLIVVAKELKIEATQYRDNEMLLATIRGDNDAIGTLATTNSLILEVLARIRENDMTINAANNATRN